MHDSPPDRPAPPIDAYDDLLNGEPYKPTPPHQGPWQPQPDFYLLTSKGAIRPLFGNLVTLLRMEGGAWNLWYNEFAMRPMIGNRPVTDADIRTITEWAHQGGIGVSPQMMAPAIWRHCEQYSRNPVKEYLDRLVWDGVSRIDMMLIDHAGAVDTDLTRAMTSRWLIQAAARVYEPGCIARSTLILEGEQNIGKSTFFRVMFGAAQYTDHLPNLNDKDALIQLRGIWCVEIAEFAAFRGKEAAKIKQFLTVRSDRYRDPYGVSTGDWPRTCVFGATVNPGADGYLSDETGGSRFWPITCADVINIAAIEQNRDQFWAEAVVRYKAGEPWYLNDNGLNDAAALEQADRAETDPWDELISDFVKGRTSVSNAEVFNGALSFGEKSRWGKAEQMRVGRILTRMGWRRRVVRKGKSVERRWYCTNESDDPQTTFIENL